MKLSILLSLLLPSIALAFTAAPLKTAQSSKTALEYGYRGGYGGGGYDDYEYGRGGGLMLPSSKSPRDRVSNEEWHDVCDSCFERARLRNFVTSCCFTV